MDAGRPRVSSQLALVLGAGFVWAWFPLPTVSALVWAYLALVLVAGFLRRQLRAGEFRIPAELAWPLALLLVGPFAWALHREGANLVANSQLEGLVTVYQDRSRGLGPAQIHPVSIRDDQPQVLWARAEAEAQLELRLGDNGPSLSAQAVGPAIWRAVYDPEVHGPLPAEGPLTIDIGASKSTVTAVRAGARPARLSEIPGGGALGVSEETDELLHLDPRGTLRRMAVEDGPIRAVALSATVAAVIHRFSPGVRRIALSSGAALSSWAVPGALIDIAAEDRHVAVLGREPNRLVVLGPTTEWQQILSFSPRRVVSSGSPEAWFVEAEVTSTVYRVTASGVLEVGRLGRPLYDARPLSRDCLEAFVPDYRPLGDAGANHQTSDHRVHLCRGKAPEAESTLERDASGTVSGGAGPCSVSPAGAIAFIGSDEYALPGRRRQPSPISSPNSIASLGGGRWAISSAAVGAIVVLDERGAVLTHHDLAGVESTSAARLRRGERAFREATRSGASCASCHVDADSDRGFHDIGHPTPRPTLSVRGVAGTAPFLRVASYPDLSGLEHFAQTLLGGYQRASSTRALDLVAYVESLPAHPPKRELDPEAWRQGWRAFERAGCPSCHPPPAFTNRAQYPQQVLFPEKASGVLLDTPSLIGVASSPPYLYDGRAPSLRSIFEEHDPSHRHGRFEALDIEGRARLLRFLEAL